MYVYIFLIFIFIFYLILNAIKIMGVFFNNCRSFVKDLARRIRLQNNDSSAYLSLCHRISVVIQRYNSVCVLGSCA